MQFQTYCALGGSLFLLQVCCCVEKLTCGTRGSRGGHIGWVPCGSYLGPIGSHLGPIWVLFGGVGGDVTGVVYDLVGVGGHLMGFLVTLWGLVVGLNAYIGPSEKMAK